jgi:hypothetical protein
MDTRYDTDFYSWAMAQAELARTLSSNELDWDNVALELKLLGISEERELKSRLIVLGAHLLKWMFQPERQSRSWENTINDQRAALDDHLLSDPGLKSKLGAAFSTAYVRARFQASTEADLDLETFPAQLPFTHGQALSSDFWPSAPLPESAAQH